MTRWFPLAPGTTLGPAPAEIAGQITATKTVPVWNETVLLTARTKTVLAIESYGYALNQLTMVDSLSTRTRVTVSNIAPVIEIGFAAVAPAIATGLSVKPPIAELAFGAVTPAVTTGARIDVPLTALGLAAAAVEAAGPLQTSILASAINIDFAALLPAISRGTSLSTPAADIATAAAAPSGIGYLDPSFTNVSLLLHMDGSNASTTFTDNSPIAATGTAYGNAQISTAQSKFGGASGLFDGNGDYVEFASRTAYDLGSTYTIDMFIRVPSTSVSGGLVHRGFYTTSNNTWSGLAFSIRGLGTSIRFYFYGTLNSNEQYIDVAVSGNISANTWHHVAMVRNGTSGAVYIDGVSKGTITGLNTVSSSSRVLKIGVWDYSSGSEWFNGYMDELRITKVARYTSGFTPPAAPFANQ